MSDFHKLEVEAIYKETSDTSVVTFRVPDALKNDFKFQQGQHLTLKAILNGEDVRRSYSLCSSPFKNKWQVAVKQIPEGKFSTYINTEVEVGTTLEVMPPSGNFGVPTSKTAKNYVAFAAGSGITPILSMIKAHLEAEPEATFQLFYLNRTVKSIIFKEELEQLRNKFFGRLEIFYFLTKELRDIELFNGRFTSEKLQHIFKGITNVDAVSEVFLCGPEDMIFLVRDEFVKAGLAKEHIHYELFVSGLSEEDKKRAERLSQQKVEGKEITIVDGGKQFHFVMPKDYDNILDAALAAGADLPYACKGGVCSTCKCKVVEGSVEMKINYALEEDEVKQNLVLSCQAVPTTDKVLVDFDV